MSTPLHVHFGGHSTLLLEIDGVKVLTDPLLREWLLHIKRHAPEVDMAIFGDPDVILISHGHLDHLDKQSLKRLDRKAHVIAPPDAVKLLSRLGYGRVTALSPGQSIETHGLKVIAVPALHGGGRMPWSNDADALGFLVEGGHESGPQGSPADSSAGHSFYFAGDTDIYPAMAELSKLTPKGIDLALLPVWGWGPKVGKGHLDPVSAARAAKLLDARVTVPIHWGGYFPFGLKRTHGRLLADPPHEFAQLVERMSLPTKVEIIQPGGRFELPPRSQERGSEQSVVEEEGA